MFRSSFFIAVSASMILSACGQSPTAALPPVGIPTEDGVVVARASVPVSIGEDSTMALLRRLENWFIAPVIASSLNQPATVVLASNTQMTLSTAAFRVPTPANSVLSFGSLSIGTLITNNLRVCGSEGTEKCTKAFFRIYTTGVAGSGFWNATDGYGMPITVTGPTSGSPGLGVSGAIEVQSIALAADKNVVRLTDFTPAPKYTVSANFTNAGAGTYATTMVVEFVLRQ